MDEVKKNTCKDKLKSKKSSSYNKINEDDYEKNVKSNKEFKKTKQEYSQDEEDWNYWQEYYK